MDDEMLEFKVCNRPILTRDGVDYEKTLCPIADRCKYREIMLKENYFLCCADAIYETLKEEGYFIIRSGRANIVVTPSEIKTKEGFTKYGLKIIIFGDPDSGISNRDEIFITGFRFGIDDVLIEGWPVYTVHENFGNDVKYCIARLITHIRAKDDRLGKEKSKKFIEWLKEIGEALGVEVDENCVFDNTYLLPEKVESKRALIKNEE